MTSEHCWAVDHRLPLECKTDVAPVRGMLGLGTLLRDMRMSKRRETGRVNWSSVIGFRLKESKMTATYSWSAGHSRWLALIDLLLHTNNPFPNFGK